MFVCHSPTSWQIKGVTIVTVFIAFLVSFAASIIADVIYALVCKWLENHRK